MSYLSDYLEKNPGKPLYDETSKLLFQLRPERAALISLLVELGISVNKANNNNETALYAAAQNGHLQIVQALWGAGADVHQPVDEGSSPLHVAAYNGYSEVVHALCGMGARARQTMNDGSSPLHVAAYCGHLEVVQALLEVGASLLGEWSPLYIASARGHLGLVQELLRRGADLHQVRKIDGRSPLYVAAENGHLGVVQALLDAGANIHQVRDDGGSPLFIAAARGHLGVVQELLRRGADVHQVRKIDGQSPLRAAAINEHLEVVQALLNSVLPSSAAFAMVLRNLNFLPMNRAFCLQLIDFYLQTLSDDGHHRRTPWFGYTAGQKRAAALAFSNVLSGQVDRSTLTLHHGALTSGRLGKIYRGINLGMGIT